MKNERNQNNNIYNNNKYNNIYDTYSMNIFNTIFYVTKNSETRPFKDAFIKINSY